VGLIVQIEAVGDEFFQLDINGTVEGSSATAAKVGPAAFSTVSTTTGSIAARASFGTRTSVASAARGTVAAVPSGAALGRSGTCPTGFRFIVSTFFGTWRSRRGCRCRRLRLNGFDRFWSFLRLRRFEIFYYGLHFVWHCFPFVTTRPIVSPILAPRGLPVAT
jgi:hypothetical protein